MIGRPSPSASAREAKLCRMSWMRTSWSPARARMLCHAPSMSVMWLPGLAPGTTQRLPGTRGGALQARRRPRATGGLVRERQSCRRRCVKLGLVEIDMLPPQGEDFVPAGSRSASAGGWSSPRRRISRLPFPETSSSTLPEAGELGVGQEPLPFALGVRRDGPGRDCRSPRAAMLPVAGERAYMCAQGRDNVMFAIAGVSHRLSCCAKTWLRSTAASGSLPRAGTMWRLIDAAGRPLRFRLAADQRHVPRDSALARSATVGPPACFACSGSGTGSSPALMRAMMSAARWRACFGAEHRVATDRDPLRLAPACSARPDRAPGRGRACRRSDRPGPRTP